MCTALKFIPEWLFTMLPFENERNASIFLQSRKILLASERRLWASIHGNGQGKTQTTIRQALQFQSPMLKWRGVLFDALRLPFALSQSPLLQQPTVHLSSLPRCKKKFSMVMLRLQCIHFLVLLPSSTLGFLLQELSRDR